MKRLVRLGACGFIFSYAEAQEIHLLRRKPDPYGIPRPSPGQQNVPTATSLYFQLTIKDNQGADRVLPDSIRVEVQPQNGTAVEVLGPRGRFADGYTGRVFTVKRKAPGVAVYIDRHIGFEPDTLYLVSVQAKSSKGLSLTGKKGQWRFTTGRPAARHELQYSLDLARPSVRWHGSFFTGFCKPSFCTSASNRLPSYELIDRIRKTSPKTLSLVRDVSPTGVEYGPRFLPWHMPNVVRERETRRITAMAKRDDGILLRVEDFFGHQQYGIPTDRPITGDFHPGDQVLIADGTHDATTEVLRILEDTKGARRLLVSPFKEPGEGWKIEYAGKLPTEENPNAPGLFPPGGCYLHKFRPVGRAHYYWGRLDKEWDISHRRFGRRLVVNFCEAPGDLSVDGRNWTYPKDYAQHHEVVHAITSHVIERYGKACLEFYWSVFNEPDLAKAFWRSGDWNELQKFYDYTVDAVLRAFEDAGFDSDRVTVGGLEIGAIFGTHIENPILKKFLVHCSPTVHGDGALPKNAAFIDKRLEGKRSKRVEKLCRKHEGKGTPCDFISVHTYNAAPMAAAKLIRAKDLALEIDATYYADLWINSFESCPNWSPPPDIAADDSYLGNGYFSTWCADVVRRQLAMAAQDNRYAFGETILTFWPWPNSNFKSINNATRMINVDDDGDGKTDRKEAVAMPILNFLACLSRMGDDYRVLPEQQVAGHAVSGFVSKQDSSVLLMLYAHDPHDTQSRSEHRFKISLTLDSIKWPRVTVKEHRFDKEHNSYFELGRQLRDHPGGRLKRISPTQQQVDDMVAGMTSKDHKSQLAAIKRAGSFSDLPDIIFITAMELHSKTHHPDVRALIEETGKRFANGKTPAYRPEDVARVKALSVLQATRETTIEVGPDHPLALLLDLAANGINFIEITPGVNP